MKKRLRILFVTNNYTPYTGGVVSSIDVFRSELEALGHTVYVVAPDFLGKQQPSEHHVIRLQPSLRFQFQKKHIAVPFFAHRQLATIIKAYKPDIVHVHHPFLLGPVAFSLARKYTMPTVFTYHTMYEMYAHYTHLPEKFARFAIEAKVKKFCRSVDGIIAPSSTILMQIRHYGVTCPAVTIPTPVAPFFLEDSGDRLYHHPTIRLLYVGRFEKEKNITFLLDVMKMLVSLDIQLFLVGYGSQIDRLKTYAYVDCGLSLDQVTFIERPPKEKLYLLYQESDLFVFPSITDTQGIVLAEAMACGLPIVAVDGPGQRDSVQHGYNGLIVHTTDEMAAAITMLCAQRGLLRDMSVHARAMATRFAPRYCTEQLVDFYKKVG